MIPETFFTKLAAQSPFVIFQNQLYQLAGSSEGDDFVSVGGGKFALVPSSDLSELEALYRDVNNSDIFQYQKDFIEDKLNKEMKSQQEMELFMGDNKPLHFILYELFPLIVEDDDEVDSFLEGKMVDEKEVLKKIEDNIGDAFGKIEVSEAQLAQLKKELLVELGLDEDLPQKRVEKKQIILDTDDDEDLEELLDDFYEEKGLTFIKPEDIKLPEPKAGTGLSDALGEESVFVFRGDVYKLDPVGMQDDAPHVILSNTRFNLRPFTNVSRVEADYQLNLSRQLKVEAVEGYEEQLREIQEIRLKNEALKKFMEKKEYEIGNIGYIRRKEFEKDAFYIYQKVPKFAMKKPDSESVYLFDECKVAVQILHESKKFSGSNSYVIGPYRHPFIPLAGTYTASIKESTSDAYKFQKICMGDTYKYRKPALDNPNGILQFLSDSVNVILNGYIEGKNPYSENNFRNLAHKKTTEREARKKGYLITNVHVKEERQEPAHRDIRGR